MPTVNSLEDILRRHADAFPGMKLDHDQDAHELMLSSFGIGKDAVRLALDTDPMVKAVYDTLHRLISDILQVNYDQRRRKTVDTETAKTIFDAGWKAGVSNVATNPLYGMGEAKQAAFEMLLQGIDPTAPAKPAEPTPKAPSAKAIDVSQHHCNHNWRYTGTDGHGSHKGEDHYRCVNCGEGEYRP